MRHEANQQAQRYLEGLFELGQERRIDPTTGLFAKISCI